MTSSVARDRRNAEGEIFGQFFFDELAAMLGYSVPGCGSVNLVPYELLSQKGSSAFLHCFFGFLEEGHPVHDAVDALPMDLGTTTVNADRSATGEGMGHTVVTRGWLSSAIQRCGALAVAWRRRSWLVRLLTEPVRSLAVAVYRRMAGRPTTARRINRTYITLDDDEVGQMRRLFSGSNRRTQERTGVNLVELGYSCDEEG